MTWFEKVFGFRERSYDETSRQFSLEDEGETLVCSANRRRYQIGPFETPSVAELHARLQARRSCAPRTADAIRSGLLKLPPSRSCMRVCRRDARVLREPPTLSDRAF